MQTYYTNKDFMDPVTGKGLVADAWKENHVYRTGPGNAGRINSYNAFLERLIEHQLGGRLTSRASEFFYRARVWSEQFNDAGLTQDVRDIRLERAQAMGPNTEKKFVLRYTCDPVPIKRDGACTAEMAAKDDKPPTQVDKSTQRNELALDSSVSSLEASDFTLDDEQDLTDTDDAHPAVALGTEDGGTKISLARASGKLATFTAVGKDVLNALGIAGTVTGAVFVIIDFIDHNWVGGAIGAVGLTAGVAAGLALSGPMGWIIGGAITALFASTSTLSYDICLFLMRIFKIIDLCPVVSMLLT